MDFITSPLFTAFLDLLSRTAVSAGIIDIKTQADFVQATKAIVIALMMIIPNSIILAKLIEKKPDVSLPANLTLSGVTTTQSKPVANPVNTGNLPPAQ